jgi:TetR/AcrR family transcriptional regulator, repressor for divergent bdcA
MTTNNSRPRGRPRAFDADAAIAMAQHMFHERGYDAVSVADVTGAIGINPPSFYAAFGSKAGLFSRILDRYALTGAIPLNTHLRPEVPVADGLARTLEDAARHYAANATASGCLVLEGTRANDPEARAAACGFHRAALERIHAYIAERHPDEAERLTDFVNVTMIGLSTEARRGLGLDRLLAAAGLASLAIKRMLAP